ncbi:acylphosphatase [Pararhodobacter sp. SW119]|uniref:acylphosphatase n=1 Tax=Pararhodobacter sp. SW119 TaxID=2780075 RepID=UPI0032AF74C8
MNAHPGNCGRPRRRDRGRGAPRGWPHPRCERKSGADASSIRAQPLPPPTATVSPRSPHRDREVEAVVSGPSEAVDALIAAVHEGPPAAQVEDVRVTETEAPEKPGLHIRGRVAAASAQLGNHRRDRPSPAIRTLQDATM